jgi:lipopolysaccharide transport system ATP-binding protein
MLLCELDSVALRYRRRFGRTSTLKERTLLWLRGARTSEVFWALRDVGFQIRRGETVGVIGANGSGKSSLLKLIAGIYPPDLGSVRVYGRVAALLELGAGFQPDMTGRENVFLYGAVLGLERAELEKRFEDIHRFSELGELVDTPVRHYSSGMVTRLGFAVAAHLDPDLLLIDEILAVGDFNFQQKCIDHMVGYRDSGRALLFVSHDLDAVSKLCGRTLWLDGGKLLHSGPTDAVLQAYRVEMERRRGGEHGRSPDRLGRWGTGEIEIVGLRQFGPSGQPRTSALPGEPLTLEVQFIAHRPVEDPVVGLGLHHHSGAVLSGPNTRQLGLRLGSVSGPGAISFHLPALSLLPGHYTLSASVYDAQLTHAYDHRERAWPLLVSFQPGLDPHGCVQLPWQAKKREAAVP